MELVEFLLARIAEDEAEIGPILGPDESAGPNGIGWAEVGAISDVLMSSHRRALAECEAKRRIVERCRPQYVVLYRESERPLASAFDQSTVKTEGHSGPIWPFEGAESILRDLAAVYADHPDYREEWRP